MFTSVPYLLGDTLTDLLRAKTSPLGPECTRYNKGLYSPLLQADFLSIARMSGRISRENRTNHNDDVEGMKLK